MKNLLKLLDCTTEEILEIINLAEQLKYEQKNGIEHKLLTGKTLGMIFEKSSTRTRVSFEVGMTQLGGYPMFLSGKDMQISRGEFVEDTARVLARYIDAIMIRTFSQQEVEDLAKYSGIPVINGLTDEYHPCQVLADLLTIKEYKSRLKDINFCYIGDGNNMANSLIVGCLKVGMHVSVAVPKGYEPSEKVLKFAEDFGTNFVLINDPYEAAKDADVVYTDVWASMGQEDEAKKRIVDFKGYQVNGGIMAVAKNDAIVLHCLPAHREEEISAEIFEKHSNEIFDQAENRLHAQKAVLVKLMK